MATDLLAKSMIANSTISIFAKVAMEECGIVGIHAVSHSTPKCPMQDDRSNPIRTQVRPT